jgi:hypothetical protein
LKIILQQLHRRRRGQTHADKAIHRPLLNLRPGFPARHGRFADAQQVSELFLSQPKPVAALADVFGTQKLGHAPESGADLLVRFIVDADCLAVTALR